MTYAKDINSHGVSDYWQTPEETLTMWSGDCEDFAIFEMAAWYTAFSEKGKLVCLYNYNNKSCHMVFVVTRNNSDYMASNGISMDVYMKKNGYSIWSTYKYETAMYMAFVVKTPKMVKGNY